MNIRVPKGYTYSNIKSGEYAIPKNIFELLNAVQMTKDVDNYNRLVAMIESRHKKTPILKWGGKDWIRARLDEI